MIVGGAFICLIGSFGPLLFALALFPATLMGSCVRTPGAFLMLEQQKQDTGSASALINCSSLVFGCAGILLATLDPDNLILVLGTIYISVGVVCLAGWQLIGRLNIIREVPDMPHTARLSG